MLVEEEGSTYMTDNDGDSDEARTLRPLQAAPGQWPSPSPGTNSRLDCSCSGSAYRIAFGPRARQKLLTLQGAMPTETDLKQSLCADIDAFSLHAAVRCAADDRQALGHPSWTVCARKTDPIALRNNNLEAEFEISCGGACLM